MAFCVILFYQLNHCFLTSILILTPNMNDSLKGNSSRVATLEGYSPVNRALSFQGGARQEKWTERRQGAQRTKNLTKNLDCGGTPQDFARSDHNVAGELLVIIVDLDWREVEFIVCT